MAKDDSVSVMAQQLPVENKVEFSDTSYQRTTSDNLTVTWLSCME